MFLLLARVTVWVFIGLSGLYVIAYYYYLAARLLRRKAVRVAYEVPPIEFPAPGPPPLEQAIASCERRDGEDWHRQDDEPIPFDPDSCPELCCSVLVGSGIASDRPAVRRPLW